MIDFNTSRMYAFLKRNTANTLKRQYTMTTLSLFQESKDGPRFEAERTFLNLIKGFY